MNGDRRYISRHVPIPISGKQLLQSELDNGAEKGWNLVSVFYVEKNNWILVVWENPAARRS